MTKEELMRLVFEGRLREAFEFDPDDGTPKRVYDITELRLLIYNETLNATLMSIEMACCMPFVMERRVWEQARVDSLSELDLTDPAIFLLEKDGSHTLVDGTHRIIRQYQMGCEAFLAYVLPEELAPRLSPYWVQRREHDWGASLQSIAKKP